MGKKLYDRFLKDYVRKTLREKKDSIINEVLPKLQEAIENGISGLSELGMRIVRWIQSFDPVNMAKIEL